MVMLDVRKNAWPEEVQRPTVAREALRVPEVEPAIRVRPPGMVRIEADAIPADRA